MTRLITAMSLVAASYGLSRLVNADARSVDAQSWNNANPSSPQAKAAITVAESVQALDKALLATSSATPIPNSYGRVCAGWKGGFGAAISACW